MPTRRSTIAKNLLRKVKPIRNGDVIRYAIYVRRSQEDDEKQKESIPQQLEKCLHLHEKDESLNLLRRDRKLFPIDKQTLVEIGEAFGKSPATAEKIRDFYLEYAVVAERKSARTPYKRQEWSRLIELVKNGVIRGIFGYSPDRMARNLQEGGEVIQLIDSQLLQVRFTNFVFEDTPSGHMMLGIFFVFAEHYSKKLSEDSTRGQLQASYEGKTDGASKLGYTSDEHGYWVQDPVNAPILRKAFKRKTYDNWSDESIAEEMMKLGWSEEKPMTGKRISGLGLWDDPFFYGVWEREFAKEGTQRIPLLELTNHPYEPIISEDEFLMLQEVLEQRNKKSAEQRRSRHTKVLNSATPLAKNIVVDAETGETLKFSIPNKKRHTANFEKLTKNNPKAVYGDVIDRHQIKYALPGNNINFEQLDDFIYQRIKKVKILKYHQQAFLYEQRAQAGEIHKESLGRKKRLTLLKNKLESDRDSFKSDSRFGVGLSEEDLKIYNFKIDSFNSRIEGHQESLKKVEDDERDEIFELQAFAEVFLNISKLWDRANYVQKRKISEFLILNITVKNGSPVTLRVKPELEGLFPDLVRDGGPGWN